MPACLAGCPGQHTLQLHLTAAAATPHCCANCFSARCRTDTNTLAAAAAARQLGHTMHCGPVVGCAPVLLPLLQGAWVGLAPDNIASCEHSCMQQQCSVAVSNPTCCDRPENKCERKHTVSHTGVQTAGVQLTAQSVAARAAATFVQAAGLPENTRRELGVRQLTRGVTT
jgi:hypothetical protein